jgi:hypothetical protein
MQKLLLSVCLLVSVMYVSAQRTATKRSSSKSSDHNNAVKLGVNTFFDTDEFPFNVAWETKVGANQSIQIGVLPRFTKFNEEKTSGVGVSLAYRKYISKNRSGIQGLFISPIIKAGFLNANDSYTSYYYNGMSQQPQYYAYSSKRKINQYNVGFVFGHKWAYRSGFTFEASGGIGYYNTKEKYLSTSTGGSTISASGNKYNSSGILPQLQLSFGYAF